MADSVEMESFVDEDGASYARFHPSTPEEIKAYQAVIRSDKPVCPDCGDVIQPERNQMNIDVPIPIASVSILGMDMCLLNPTCPKCGTIVPIDGQMIVDDAFPSVAAVIANFRKQAAQKGVSNGEGQ